MIEALIPLDQPENVELVVVRPREISMANNDIGYDQMHKLKHSEHYVESLTLNLREENADFLSSLKDNSPNREVQKRIEEFLKVGRSLDEAVSSPSAVAVVLSVVNKDPATRFEFEFDGKWYPVKMDATLRMTMFGPMATLMAKVDFWGFEHTVGARIMSSDFMENGSVKQRSVRDVLLDHGIRVASSESVEAMEARLLETYELGVKYGTVIDITGNVVVKSSTMWGWNAEVVQLGSPTRPVRGIIEGELDGGKREDFDEDDEESDVSSLPYVRVFVPQHKTYVYVELSNFKKHEFDKSMKDSVVLPPEMKNVMNAVFDAGANTFGDIFTGRHGGMVIMANGPSGVGKTLTAEVFAETSGRPLYVMEMGELGTNLANVETALQRIFKRASRWNAVLLFDEADIFLARRDNDLERSAIVGVFLRLLDYYEGMFFLTTNRGDVIDDAMKSRITLRLDYKELTDEARAAIWANNLKRGGFQLDVGDDKVTPTAEMLADIAKTQLNGRQIRNQIRLLSVLHPNRVVTTADIIDANKYVA